MPQTVAAEATKKIWIPEVSKKEIRRRAERIKPIVRMARFTETAKRNKNGSITWTQRKDPKGEWQATWSGDGQLYHICPIHLFNRAFTWAPKPTKRAKGVKMLCDITTYHSYSAPSLFKPSIAEVLAQIPAEHLDKVVAFEIVGSPDTADDLNQNSEALNAGYHVAKTRLYVRR